MNSADEIDQVISRNMLQSKHYEEEGDKIIKELLEDLQIHDMHKSMAVIFDKKNEQILQLKRQNTALRKKNLELQKQVQILPLNQSGLPVEYQPSGYNSSGMNFSSESEKEKMIQLQEMTKVARSNNNEYKQKFDRLMEDIIRYFSKLANGPRLRQYFQSRRKNIGEDNDHVVLPRKDYELLIEIYSITMAEESVKFMRETLSRNNQQDKLVLPALRSRQLMTKYRGISEDLKINDTALGIFFRSLAEKAGCKDQWQRYHTRNTEKAVNLQTEINRILKTYDFKQPQPFYITKQTKNYKQSIQFPTTTFHSKIPNTLDSNEVEPLGQECIDQAHPQENEEKEQQKQLVQKQVIKEKKDRFLTKIRKIIDCIPFHDEQRAYWQQFDSKIRQQEIMSVQTYLTSLRTSMRKGKLDETVRQIGEIIMKLLYKSFEVMQRLFKGKGLGKSLLRQPQIEALLEEELPEKLIEAIKCSLESSKWTKTLDWAEEKMLSIVAKLEKNIVSFNFSRFRI